MIEKQIEIATKAGRMNTFVCHPERGGPHPVVIFFMDAPGIREELRDMARRLATSGYYVLLPNLYYRSNVEELGPFIGEAHQATRKQLFDLMGTLTIPLVMDDADALITFAQGDAAASTGAIGCVGYCMSGQYAVGTAARHPDRVGAAASFYGVRLVTDAPDSPHVTARHAKAELYIAFAETDQDVPLDLIAPLKPSLSEANVKAEIEVYPGVEHGFAFPQRPAYNKAAAEKHWERMLALFDRTLKA